MLWYALLTKQLSSTSAVGHFTVHKVGEWLSLTPVVPDILPLENLLEAVSIEPRSGLQSGILFCLIMTVSSLCIYFQQTPF